MLESYLDIGATGVRSFCEAGVATLLFDIARKKLEYVYPKPWWPVAVWLAVILLIVIVPNGWHAMFGPDLPDFDAIMRGEGIVRPFTLFKADCVGAALGVVAGFIAGAAAKKFFSL